MCCSFCTGILLTVIWYLNCFVVVVVVVAAAAAAAVSFDDR